MRNTRIMQVKLRFGTVLSRLLTLIGALLWAGQLAAHEISPTIADMEVKDGQLELIFDLTLESHLADINLDGLTDTNDAENGADYDRLRALPAFELAGRASGLVARWNDAGVVQMGGAVAALGLVDVQVTEVDNLELPRNARLVVSTPMSADTVQIAWPLGSGDLVLRQQGVEEPYTGYLAGGGVSEPIALAGGSALTGWQAFVEYIPVGFDHILPKGLDHILFVLGLFFLSMGLGALLWQVTAFTAAHTVTLALGALGIVNIPGHIVEPLIAASIVYVAVENIFASKLNPLRPVIIFLFGLLHGLGFASVLGDFGLPQGQFIPALLGFNVGVEIGQLTVIAIAAVLVGWAASRPWYRKAIAVPASCVIAVIGAYWVIERTLL